MGIKGLTKLLADNAPKAMKEQKFESYFGRKIAIDASMSIYQFLVRIISRFILNLIFFGIYIYLFGSLSGISGRLFEWLQIVVGRTGTEMLTNEAGEVTSHLQGMFTRTIRLLEAGIKPVYSRRADANADLAQAVEAGNKEDIEKFSKRTVKVTKQHNEDCKRLLKLMGVPVVEAPSEAEAECAALCKSGKVYAVASEDMDSLTFGAPRFLRHLMDPSSRKIPVMEFEVSKVLGTVNWRQTALKLIRQHGSIENILENINKERYQIPEDWPYQEARRLFKEPVVLADEEEPEIKWTAPDEEGLITFLVNENGFNSDRVTKAIEKIKAAKNKSSQGRKVNVLFNLLKPAIKSKMFSLQVCNCSVPKVNGSLSCQLSIWDPSFPHHPEETPDNNAKETTAKKSKAGGGRKKK
ncbi:hypothetical protein GH714_006568 [Hevea brasiliensis]|uniref:Flap endonuclease 1 n=1 Tax=Hevea brasiliensis TaxID=3981 RepID=A0A6A6NG65_HEVBR|nr:hypothetical protein GH714_006568 [Hevea brasiliensis]